MEHKRTGAPVLDLRLGALSYGGQPILQDIALTVPRGQTVALVGPSGIGKSSLLRVFAVKPALLLLDEPFVSLDPALVEDMMTLFSTLRAAHQVTTVLVTHVAAETHRLADRIVTLAGSPARIVSI